MRAGRIVTSKRLLLAVAALVSVVVTYFGSRPLLAEWHHARARRFLEQQDQPRAMEELQAALWMAPHRPETFFLLARTHRRLGNLDRVLPLLRCATELGGDAERAQRETWLLSAQRGWLRDAEPHLPQLLMDPRGDGADICQAYAMGYFANLRTSEARRLLEVWQKDYPHDPQPYFMQGYLAQGLHRSAEAADFYRQGLELGPGNTLMRHRLAEALIQMREWERAEQELARCLSEAPHNPDILASWGNWLVERGQRDRAREVLQELAAHAPDHFEARRLLGELSLTEGRFAEALPHLEAAVTQRPYGKQARWALARTLQSLGRAEEAKPHFEYVAEAERALAEIDRLIRQAVSQPSDPQIRYKIGVLLLKFGPPEDGAKWLLTVLQLAPDHRRAHEALAAYYEVCGEGAIAQLHRQQAGREPAPAAPK